MPWNADRTQIECPGVPQSFIDLEATGLGHHLLGIYSEDGETSVFCTRCGYWATQKARELRRPCKGHPHRTGEHTRYYAIDRVARGRHPRTPSVRLLDTWSWQHGLARARPTPVPHAPQWFPALEPLPMRSVPDIASQVLAALRELPTAAMISQGEDHLHDPGASFDPELSRRREFDHEDRVRRVNRRARILGRFPTWDEVTDLFDRVEYEAHFGGSRAGAELTGAEEEDGEGMEFG